MEWHSKNHTNSLVPFFAKGAGAEQFKNTIDGNDSVRGPYIDNTDIANTIFTLWLAK
jgi:alkaline phosphatase